jgi:hypothetical protein
MPLSDEELTAILVSLLTHSERDASVVYFANKEVAAATALSFPRVSITAPWDALPAFVDRDPRANWSHSCRYILISRETGETISFEAQLPPFGQGDFQWRVIYKAASVPEAVLARNQ